MLSENNFLEFGVFILNPSDAKDSKSLIWLCFGNGVWDREVVGSWVFATQTSAILVSLLEETVFHK